MALEVPSAQAALRGFIIAITQRGRLRRVHYGGGCFRKPGEHYLDGEELGSVPQSLPSSMLNKRKHAYA